MFAGFLPIERRNTLLSASGEALWGLQISLVAPATVLTVLLTGFGAGPRLIGAIPAIEGTLIVLPQILGMWLFHSLARRQRNLVAWHLLVPIPMLFLSGVLLLSPACEHPAFMCGALLLLFAAFTGGIGVIVAVWMDWLADLFRPAIRGTAIGVSFAASALAGTAGGLLAGLIIGRWPALSTYGILYLVAGVIAACSFVAFGCIRDPLSGAEQETPTRSPPAGETWVRFRASLSDRNFRRYVVGRSLAVAGFGMVPFIALNYQSAQGGGLASGTIVAAGSVMTLGSAVGNLVFGKLGDRWGHRLGVIVGAVLQTVTLALLLSTRGLWSCILSYFLAGICVSSSFVSHSNLLYETCPHGHRLSHITLGNLVFALPLMLGGLLAGQVAHSWGLRSLFGLCLVLSLGGAVWMTLRVRDPRGHSVSRG